MLERNNAKLEHLTAQLDLAQTSQSNLAKEIPGKHWEDVWYVTSHNTILDGLCCCCTLLLCTLSKLFEAENRASLEALTRKQKESCLDKLEDELTELTEARHNSS